MKISPLILIVYIALILTSHIVAIDRELVRKIVREIERHRTRTDQNNNISREPNRNIPSNNNDRREPLSICVNFSSHKVFIHDIEKDIYKREKAMRIVLICIGICLLPGCYTAKQNIFTECAYSQIAIGDCIDNVVALYGQPFQIFSIGRELYEYEYLEKWFIGRESIVQKKYYFLVRDRKILNKRSQTIIPPSYDSLYYYQKLPATMPPASDLRYDYQQSPGY